LHNKIPHLERHLMKGVFACARTVGWLAMFGASAALEFDNQQAAHADLWSIVSDTPGTVSRLVRFNWETGEELSGGLPHGTSGLARPSGITTGPEGALYISSRGIGAPEDEGYVAPGVISTFCDDAGVCSTPAVFADFTAGDDPTEPAGLKFGPDGNLYVNELFFVGGDDMRVYSSFGARLANAVEGFFPTSISFNRDGSLLVGTPPDLENMIPVTIQRFVDGMQVFPLYIDNPMEPQLGVVGATLELSNGDTLAVDTFGGRVVRISPAGVLSHFAFIPESIPSAPTFPSDIAFDPEGNVIVSVLGPNNIGDPGGPQGQLLRFDVLTGQLLDVIAEELEPIAGLTWTSSPLTIVGNYDGVGGVAEDDQARWQRDFGAFVARGNGADGNGDGVVDAADYVFWRKMASSPLASSSNNVPEPTCALMFLAGVLAVACRGRST
jgi:sugar lactone lactonase YvrE